MKLLLMISPEIPISGVSMACQDMTNSWNAVVCQYHAFAHERQKASHTSLFLSVNNSNLYSTIIYWMTAYEILGSNGNLSIFNEEMPKVSAKAMVSPGHLSSFASSKIITPPLGILGTRHSIAALVGS